MSGRVGRRRVVPIDVAAGGVRLDGPVAAEVVHTRTPDTDWCRSPAGAQPLDVEPRLAPLWKLLDRWSRPGRATVTSASAEVHHVLRQPVASVRAALAAWRTPRLDCESATFEVGGRTPTSVCGRIDRGRRRSVPVEIRIEPWGRRALCLRLVPQSSRAVGSARWWRTAHQVLDAVEVELARGDYAKNDPSRP